MPAAIAARQMTLVTMPVSHKDGGGPKWPSDYLGAAAALYISPTVELPLGEAAFGSTHPGPRRR